MEDRNQEPLKTSGTFDLPVAEEVLRLCRLALEEFNREQPTSDKWKLHYFLILALLRTVGEGLNVDKNNTELNPNISKEIEKFFQGVNVSKPEPEIYWGFIANETNTLLHEFASSYGTGQITDPQGNRLYPITHGHYKGIDQQCVFKGAIYWWEEQLEDIINSAGAQVLTDNDLI